MNWTTAEQYAIQREVSRMHRAKIMADIRLQRARSIRRTLLVTVALFVFWLLMVRTAHASCFQSDVRAYCCPSACAIKASSKWYQADGVLRGCMRGLGCEDSGAATVFTRCGC